MTTIAIDRHIFLTANCKAFFKVMASQVRPGLTNPSFGTGPQQSVKVIRRQPAYSIRASDFASRKQAGCMAAINSCETKPKRNAWQQGASMYAGRNMVFFPSDMNATHATR
jgi:hypothetical protein